MSRATIALSSIASAAANGIAGAIFPTRTGIPARPNRAWVDSQLSSLSNGHWRLHPNRHPHSFLGRPPPVASQKAEQQGPPPHPPPPPHSPPWRNPIDHT